MNPALDIERSFPKLQSTVLRLLGIDLTSYKNKQLSRRLTSFMARVGAQDTDQFVHMLTKDNEIRIAFRDFMTINVSEFFRDQAKFEYLSQVILPDLLSRNDRLRIWSAGCSHGAEIYSVAIILERLAASSRCDLIATDIDEVILQKASSGIYPARDVRSVSPRDLKAYFRQVGTEEYQISDRIRNRVEFSHHNLLSDRYPTNLDLIMCRNVVIYFTAQAKEKVYERFWSALSPGGYLFTGGTETMFNCSQLGFKLLSPCFYQKCDK